ncbi:MAG: cation:proton antiporter [Myxococcales bacterium]|nr:cation:proton antiporter [Myxococcales bacterium]
MPATLLALAIILAAAKLGGSVAIRFGQPGVLGELVAGLVAGNLGLLGWHGLDFVEDDGLVGALAELGVILLLFQVGLESTTRQLIQVGRSALAVGCLGVAVPFGLGWVASACLLPQQSGLVHLFVGATLTATSVGITARVLADLGQSGSPTARVILGAAVLDDVLGLVMLAVVTGLIQAADRGASLEMAPLLWIVGKAVVFLVGAMLLGTWLAPRLFRRAATLRGGGVLLGIALAFCFAMSWAASKAGLAPILGAFAAGLILEAAHYTPFTEQGEYPLEQLVHPVTSFLAPIFFVFMGFRVDLSQFADLHVVGLASALTLVAVLGKVVAGLGAFGPGVSRLAVGVGMIPRGEVGLIFANVGLGLAIAGQPVIDASTFSAVVMMILVTTLVTPPLLTWAIARAAVGPAARGS